jgi:predicted DNA-binding transcriptional regulator YafY
VKTSFTHCRNLQTLLRLSRISKLIRRRKVNAPEIADRLEVSRRNVHRDIQFLRDHLGHQIGWDDEGYFYRCKPKIILGL